MTVLYLPDAVTRALAADQATFQIHVSGETVAIRPLRSSRQRGTRTNLNLDTQTLRLSVILRVVDHDEDAVSQVFFVRAGEQAAFERRVEAAVAERLKPLEQDHARKTANLDRLIRERADTELDRRALERFEWRTLDGIERTDAHAVVRLKRAAYVGEELLLFFSVENRGERPFRLASVTVTQGDRTLPVKRARMRPLAKGLVGLVDPGSSGLGLIVLEAAALMPGQPFTVHLREPAPSRPLDLRALRLE